MLREIFNNQNNIRKQIDIKTNILKTKLNNTKLNNNYYLIKNLNQLQKVLNKILLSKVLAFI